MSEIEMARKRIREFCNVYCKHVDYRDFLSVCSELLKFDTDLNYLLYLDLDENEIEEVSKGINKIVEELINKIQP